jgi:hypothetical protein
VDNYTDSFDRHRHLRRRRPSSILVRSVAIHPNHPSTLHRKLHRHSYSHDFEALPQERRMLEAKTFDSLEHEHPQATTTAARQMPMSSISSLSPSLLNYSVRCFQAMNDSLNNQSFN